jgi:hypothetical protein
VIQAALIRQFKRTAMGIQYAILMKENDERHQANIDLCKDYTIPAAPLYYIICKIGQIPIQHGCTTLNIGDYIDNGEYSTYTQAYINGLYDEVNLVLQCINYISTNDINIYTVIRLNHLFTEKDARQFEQALKDIYRTMLSKFITGSYLSHIAFVICCRYSKLMHNTTYHMISVSGYTNNISIAIMLIGLIATCGHFGIMCS